jgi:NAD(P)-dependent dehydrogenase (short-subunit alcohol dehydrogenase family)
MTQGVRIGDYPDSVIDVEETSMKSLTGKIAVVAGATRGAGRGIACMLGEAGATVYCTGRSTRDNLVSASRPETIEETADMVTKYGGVGIPVRVDHLDKEQVEAFFERVRREHNQLDILVNDIWGGEKLTEFGTPVWEIDVDKGLQMLRTAINTHIITSRYGLPLMVERKQGLVIEVTDGDTLDYRGNFIYDIVKTTVIRMAYGLSQELKDKGITAVALTPGFLRSEEMLDHFGVTEANWRDATKKEPHFIASETPFFVGRAAAALASDPKVSEKTGKALSSWNLSDEYGFKDITGDTPHWGRYFAEHVAPQMVEADQK